MLNKICQRLYDTQGEVYQALASVLGDFEWPFTAIYCEQAEMKKVQIGDGLYVIHLYRYHTGRYELVAYRACSQRVKAPAS